MALLPDGGLGSGGGEPGPGNVLTVGTVTTLPAGQAASAQITGTSPAQVLNLSIPQGLQGIPGATINPSRYSLFTWTGSQAIANNTTFNLITLPIIPTLGGDAGVTKLGNLLIWSAIAGKGAGLIRTRINGTIGGSSGTAREWFVRTLRPDGTTIVGSKSTSKVSGTTIDNRDVENAYYISGVTDPFVTQGIQLALRNESTQTITITSLEILVTRIVNA